jgi:hypothetical protein
MSNETIANPPPDWATLDKDLHCPLCEYNLRGLTESRCPECGFGFTWAELLDALKNKHPYLFEYGRGRNIKTLCKTWWRTSLPRRFWREVNPAQNVKVGRLILYWVIASLAVVGLFVIPLVWPAIQVAQLTHRLRSQATPVPNHPGYFNLSNPGFPPYILSAAQLDLALPRPWQPAFWDEVFSRGYRTANIRYANYYQQRQQLRFGWAAIFLAWPGLTVVSLLIFRISMHQAKIKLSHVVRAVIYSCDFGLVILLTAFAAEYLDLRTEEGLFWVAMAGVCSVVTAYRLTIAFQRYLRVHLSFATVLASQMITLLIVVIMLLQIADFTRRI